MKKIITFLLAALMLFSAVACAKQTNDKDKDKTNTSGRIWAEKDLDFDGFVFNIMAAAPSNTIYNWDGSDIDCEELTGDEVLDAVYNRNQIIEATYNCDIQWVDAVNEDSVKNTLLSGTEEDAAMLSRQLWETFNLIEAGLLLDLNDPSFKHLDLSKEWYNQSLQEDIAIAGKLYGINGDMLFTDEVGMWITLFNKELAERYMPDVNLYEAVKNGTWTIDMLMEYAARATTEVVADDKMDNNDQWGYLAEPANVMALVNASGNRLAEITPEGGINMNAYSGTFQDVYRKCYATVDKSYCLMNVDVSGGWDVYDATFHEGRALFMITSLSRSIKFREMVADFGILPMPKLDTNQQDYYTWSTYCINLVSIPYTCTDPERTSAIMEALFEESSYELQPAFTVNALMYQTTRDDESVEMLELIIDSTICDIGVIYDFGGTYTELVNVASKRFIGVLTSTLNKTVDKANGQIDDLLVSLGLKEKEA